MPAYRRLGLGTYLLQLALRLVWRRFATDDPAAGLPWTCQASLECLRVTVSVESPADPSPSALPSVALRMLQRSGFNVVHEAERKAPLTPQSSRAASRIAPARAGGSDGS